MAITVSMFCARVRFPSQANINSIVKCNSLTCSMKLLYFYCKEDIQGKSVYTLLLKTGIT